MHQKQKRKMAFLDAMDWSIVPDNFRCPICKNIITNAVQADCGCQYCLDCLDQLTKNGNNVDCVKCGVRLESDGKFPDRNLEKKIKQFLTATKINCKKCNKELTLEMYQKHYSEHEPLKIVCDYCQERFRNKNDLDSHIHPLSGTCLEQPIDCTFKQAGCKSIEHSNSMDIDLNIKYLTRKTLDSHLALNQNEHLKYTYHFLNERIANLEKQTANYTDLIKFPAFQTVERKVNDVKEASDVGFFEASDSRYQSSSSSSAQSIEKATVSTPSTSPATSSMQSTVNKNLTEINMKLEILENNHKALVTDIARLQKMNDNFKQENLKYKESNKEYKTICQDLHRTLALTQVSLLTLEERLINQEKLSYNGTLLWKITNVQERIQEAKSGRQTSFYSPPFYTERNGFKMCARIYLNGDGNGRNTHLSLFFVILRGEYDALLKWPFRQKVTFILIDQSSSESKENVYDAFRPDPNSSSFRRPVSEMNIASGLPVFCPLGKLLSDDHEYIKDNTMFIKIIVDTKDLSEI